MSKNMFLQRAMFQIRGMLNRKARQGTVLLLGLALIAVSSKFVGTAAAAEEFGQNSQQEQQQEQQRQQEEQQRQQQEQQRQQEEQLRQQQELRKNDACGNNSTGKDCDETTAQYNSTFNEYQAFLGGVPAECRAGLLDPTAI